MSSSETTQDLRATLAAACARILPSDEGPGAVEAGAVDHVEKNLDHHFFGALRPWMERGVEILGSRARELFDRDFAACSPEQQDEVLLQVQQDPNFATRTFFNTLIAWTLEGFLGDPSYGGNRGGLGWRVVGISPDDPRTGFCLRKAPD